MKTHEPSGVTVEFEDERRTRAVVTVHPSWLGRLFGQRPRITRVYLSDTYWFYAIDSSRLENGLTKCVEARRHWDEQPWVPDARVLRHGGGCRFHNTGCEGDCDCGGLP